MFSSSLVLQHCELQKVNDIVLDEHSQLAYGCFVDGKSVSEAKTGLSEPKGSIAWREQKEERTALHEKRWSWLQDTKRGELSLRVT